MRNGDIGKTATFWLTFLDHARRVFMLLHAVKTSRLSLFHKCMADMADLFFSYGWYNYYNYVSSAGLMCTSPTLKSAILVLHNCWRMVPYQWAVHWSQEICVRQTKQWRNHSCTSAKHNPVSYFREMTILQIEPNYTANQYFS